VVVLTVVAMVVEVKAAVMVVVVMVVVMVVVELVAATAGEVMVAVRAVAVEEKAVVARASRRASRSCDGWRCQRASQRAYSGRSHDVAPMHQRTTYSRPEHN
jgi:hypothetical protein